LSSTRVCSLLLTFLLISSASAHVSDLNPEAPKPGSPAPVLNFTKLLQAPAGSRTDWPSLHGKVVVLEFWATWCVPCIAEIPILNSLAASLDPHKVQIISVDDEDPAVVASFLKKRPVSGWIGLDASNKLYGRYGVNVRPTTMIIDTNGRVVTTTIRPENLKHDQLLALAAGKPVTLEGAADPKTQAKLNAAVAKGFAEEMGRTGGTANALFEINLSPVDVTAGSPLPTARIATDGLGKMDVVNAEPVTLISAGANIPLTRITNIGALSTRLYNLHIEAPNADPKQLASAVELAISSGIGLHIEHHTEITDVYVLMAMPEAKNHLLESTDAGFAFINPKTQRLQCLNGSADQIAAALEKTLGIPVVNETGLSGKATASLQFDSKDIASANAALEKGLDLMLTSAKRPIERVILSPIANASKPSATKPQ
jgi:thiol-disulfide isomerase/thioredoxin